MDPFSPLLSVFLDFLFREIYQFRNLDTSGADHCALKVVFTGPDTVFVVE